MIYRISADIRYIDGPLAEMTIPAGWMTTTLSRDEAERTQQWLDKVRATRDFIRAAVTGHRYVIESVHRSTEA